MKKVLFILLVLCQAGFSQSTYNAYLKQKNFQVHRFHGLKSCYDSIIVEMNLDSTQCEFYGSGATFYGTNFNNNEIMAKSPDEVISRQYYTWEGLYLDLSSEGRDVCLSYKNNDNGYISALSVSTTLDFPNTLANVANDLTVTVTGAALNDVAIVNSSAGIEATTGAVFKAWVSSANTVIVRFLNLNASTATDLAPSTFYLKVLK